MDSHCVMCGSYLADTSRMVCEKCEKPNLYNEILELYEYCNKIGVQATLEKMWDGYAIRFPCGADFVQHNGSYGSKAGFVEPAIGCKLDYTAVSLKSAKRLVEYHKNRLNRRAEDGK